VLSQIVQLVAQAQRSRRTDAAHGRSREFLVRPGGARDRGRDLLVWGFWVRARPGPTRSSTQFAVLIIACPCALGLATPMSIMVRDRSRRAGGCLFRDAEAIERLRTIDTLIVDKTGTLTQGKPAFPRRDRRGEPRCRRRAASCRKPRSGQRASARRSDRLPQRGPWSRPRAASDFESSTGIGVRGRVRGSPRRLGNRALMQDVGRDVASLRECRERLRQDGASVMYLAV
jgi:Cu+-exporting ATPase